MSLFSFSEPEMLAFFAVLVRYSTLIALLPFTGDKTIPLPVKILFSLAVTVALYPMLLARGDVRPAEAAIWGRTTSGIVGTVAMEAVFGLIMGFVGRLVFDCISFGGNLAGNFMGFAAASTYDPHQESQTQVVGQIQLTLAMLLFLVMDGHHLMLRATLDSYHIVGMGRAGISSALNARLLEITGQVLRFAVQIAAPVAVSMFAVNVAFGIVSKAMPQLNVLVLSFAVTAMVGLLVMFLSLPEFSALSSGLFSRMEDWLETVKRAMAA